MTVGPAWFVSVTAFAFATSMTPGPNNAMLLNSGASYGLRRSVPHMLGVLVGFPVMLLALGFGAYPLLRNPVIHLALKWVGGAYLLWLAWHIARAEPALTPAEAPLAAAAPAAGAPVEGARARNASRGRPLSFFRAALFQWVNPKAWVIAAGALAAYTRSGDADAVRTTLMMIAILGAMGLVSITSWTAMGVGVSRVLRSRKALKRFNIVMALLLAASLIPVLLE